MASNFDDITLRKFVDFLWDSLRPQHQATPAHEAQPKEEGAGSPVSDQAAPASEADPNILLGCCVGFVAWGARISRANRIEAAAEYSTAYGGWFNKKDHLLFEIHRLHQVCGYLTCNPVHPDHLSLIDNTVKRISKNQGTKDSGILRFSRFIIDIDAQRLPGISSTDEERAAALAVRDRILEGEPVIRENAVWGSSGNGGWILVNMSEPNTDEARELARTTLRQLAEKYGKEKRDKAFVDIRTFNPSRPLGIPGTLKCKGENKQDRPWRMVTVDGGLPS